MFICLETPDSYQSPTRETAGRFSFGNVTSKSLGNDFAKPYRNGIADEPPNDIESHTFSILKKAIRLGKSL